jgi:hypothetical protein
MAPRRKSRPSNLPVFDPAPSIAFGARILHDANAKHALIGKIAMWYWLENPADHEYTKDVDFGVEQSSIPQIIDVLRESGAEIRQLSIGGVNAQVPDQGIRADFIDRSSEAWGNLQPLFVSAIHAASKSEDAFQGVPVTPPEHLVAMKVAAGTDKDERDAIRMLAKVSDLDVDRTRAIVRDFLGAAGIGRMEECLRRAGHPKARRAYEAGS